jgi:membrane dipeptidase
LTKFPLQDHINYVKNLIGVDHVGIGADYDGVDVVPEGVDDVSKYPALFDYLAEDGHGFDPWTPEELKKLAGLNFLRAFKAIEAVRDDMRGEDIIDDPVPYDDMIKENPNIGGCRTDVNKYAPPQSRSARMAAMGNAEGF